MKKDEAAEIALIIEQKVLHANRELLCVFGEVKSEPLPKRRNRTEIPKLCWHLSMSKGNSARIKLECLKDDCGFTANARRIAEGFGFDPNLTTVCLIRDPSSDLMRAEAVAVVPTENPKNPRVIHFGIDSEDRVVTRAE